MYQHTIRVENVCVVLILLHKFAIYFLRFDFPLCRVFFLSCTERCCHRFIENGGEKVATARRQWKEATGTVIMIIFIVYDEFIGLP